MKCYYGSEKIAVLTGSVVALGNFDGMHLGHQHLLRETIELAKSKGLSSVIYTFDPHPVDILVPEEPIPLIQTHKQRLESFEVLGFDMCVMEKFSKRFAKISPEEFFKGILIDRLKARFVIAGYDFTFGFHRKGTTALLKRLGAENNVGVNITEAQFVDDMLLSSTEVRKLIRAGFIEKANKMLGRKYVLEGKVIEGRGLGSKLGAHTANIKPANRLLPGEGVYLTETKMAGEEKFWPSITSIGYNPTFKQKNLSIETHLIGFEGDILDKEIEVSFMSKLRDQITFSSASELMEQIKKDIHDAKRLHGIK